MFMKLELSCAQQGYEVVSKCNKIIISRHVFWLVNVIFVMICLS